MWNPSLAGVGEEGGAGFIEHGGGGKATRVFDARGELYPVVYGEEPQPQSPCGVVDSGGCMATRVARALLEPVPWVLRAFPQ
ncbi:hypothetical protein PR202_gb07160 [Eleusine coracana subsp. coracana]|uniref:Uncharacterized protein n=1 Tax=Eleusine coracana subsp. coracana TaxID=191504 RepID=A0AAV5EAP2_ELECO|nr:hypothetical protein PR202_gb07160 [Eleusine coracana subsp. coracana]